MRKPFLFLFVLLLALAPLIPVKGEGEATSTEPQLEKLLQRAERASRQARFERRTEESLRGAIELYERALKRGAEGADPLRQLSIGYFMLAESFLEEEEERKAAYERGLQYGLRALKKCTSFGRLYREKGMKALADLPRDCRDVEALFGVGSNLGRLAEFKGVMNSLGDLPLLLSLYRRSLEVDESYMGAAPHRALGAVGGEVMGRMPLTFWQVRRHDLNWEKVKDHYERAIELAPKCLENYFSYAKYFALKKGQRELARKLLKRVLDSPLGEKYPLINMVAKDKARGLWEKEFYQK